MPTVSASAFPADEISRDWQVLCRDIGERRAGTAEEQRAAEYVARRFTEAGASRVTTEKFPCTSRRSSIVEVDERHGRGWRRLESASLVGAPGTPGGRPVTGELAWLELPENGPRLRPGSLRNRIVAIFGPLPTSVQLHRRLVAAAPLAVVHVDERLPFAWTKNDGVYPHWVRRFGMPPTVTVPYTDAWRWRRDGMRELKIRVVIDQPPAESQNVIAEFAGTSPGLPAIALTAHHDTQCANVGADDNASGVVALLALARVLARTRRRRSVRLISFGAEEQLSVGSFAYVSRHRIRPDQVGFVINFDSVSSPLGHWVMSLAGDPALARFASRRLAARDLDVAITPEVIPFSDQFPFNRVGVPSVWFMRTNSSGGRWQHHSAHDSLENVSVEEVRRLLAAVHPFAEELARSAKWPFAAQLPAAQLATARRIGRELFG